MPIRPEKKEGWAWLLNSTKCHYFRDSQSLCRRWAYLSNDYIDVSHLGFDDDKCKLCALRLKREKAGK